MSRLARSTTNLKAKAGAHPHQIGERVELKRSLHDAPARLARAPSSLSLPRASLASSASRVTPPLPRARARRTRGDRPLVRGRTTDAASERAKKEVVARRAHILNDGVVAPAARRRRRHRRLRAHGEEVPEPVQPGAHRAREVRARSRAPDPPASAPAASRASPRE
eukprot:29843-Pelagococcus_subviridis.AAC.2